MTYADFVLNFVLYGFLMLAFFGVVAGLVHYFAMVRPMRRLRAAAEIAAYEEAALRAAQDAAAGTAGEEAPFYPKKTSASA